MTPHTSLLNENDRTVAFVITYTPLRIGAEILAQLAPERCRNWCLDKYLWLLGKTLPHSVQENGGSTADLSKADIEYLTQYNMDALRAFEQ